MTNDVVILSLGFKNAGIRIGKKSPEDPHVIINLYRNTTHDAIISERAKPFFSNTVYPFVVLDDIDGLKHEFGITHACTDAGIYDPATSEPIGIVPIDEFMNWARPYLKQWMKKNMAIPVLPDDDFSKYIKGTDRIRYSSVDDMDYHDRVRYGKK